MLAILLTLLAATANAPCHDVVLPTVRETGHCADETYDGSFSHCTLDDDRTTAAVNQFVEQHVRTNAGYPATGTGTGTANKPEGCDHALDAFEHGTSDSGCSEPYRIGTLLSYPCRSAWTGGAHPEGAPWSINIEVGATIRELSLRDVVVSDTATIPYRALRGILLPKYLKPGTQLTTDRPQRKRRAKSQ